MSNSRDEVWGNAWAMAWVHAVKAFPDFCAKGVERDRFARDEQERLFAEWEDAEIVSMAQGALALLAKERPRDSALLAVEIGADGVSAMFESVQQASKASKASKGPMQQNERWRNIARTHFQEGFMALRRSIHLPNTTDNKF